MREIDHTSKINNKQNMKVQDIILKSKYLRFSFDNMPQNNSTLTRLQRSENISSLLNSPKQCLGNKNAFKIPRVEYKELLELVGFSFNEATPKKNSSVYTFRKPDRKYS